MSRHTHTQAFGWRESKALPKYLGIDWQALFLRYTAIPQLISMFNFTHKLHILEPVTWSTLLSRICVLDLHFEYCFALLKVDFLNWKYTQFHLNQQKYLHFAPPIFIYSFLIESIMLKSNSAESRWLRTWLRSLQAVSRT